MHSLLFAELCSVGKVIADGEGSEGEVFAEE